MLRIALLLLALLVALPAAARALRVVVISDLNGSYGSTDYASAVTGAVRRIVALAPDLVIITGDMVAGQRRDPHLSAGRGRRHVGPPSTRPWRRRSPPRASP
jgi:predicted MPP superfamily phosphohydrolase